MRGSRVASLRRTGAFAKLGRYRHHYHHCHQPSRCQEDQDIRLRREVAAGDHEASAMLRWPVPKANTCFVSPPGPPSK